MPSKAKKTVKKIAKKKPASKGSVAKKPVKKTVPTKKIAAKKLIQMRRADRSRRFLPALPERRRRGRGGRRQ